MAARDDWDSNFWGIDWIDPMYTEAYPGTVESFSNDNRAIDLFNRAWVDNFNTHSDRMESRKELIVYMSETYNVNWEAVFDWEAWREAYEREG